MDVSKEDWNHPRCWSDPYVCEDKGGGGGEGERERCVKQVSIEEREKKRKERMMTKVHERSLKEPTIL